MKTENDYRSKTMHMMRYRNHAKEHPAIYAIRTMQRLFQPYKGESPTERCRFCNDVICDRMLLYPVQYVLSPSAFCAPKSNNPSPFEARTHSHARRHTHIRLSSPYAPRGSPSDALTALKMDTSAAERSPRTYIWRRMRGLSAQPISRSDRRTERLPFPS